MIFIYTCFALVYLYYTYFSIRIKKQHWKTADESEIVNKFLEIFYLTDYNIWVLTVNDDHGLRKTDVSYSDIYESYYQLDYLSKIAFRKYCANAGLMDILENIIN